jgi:hypothetical protein
MSAPVARFQGEGTAFMDEILLLYTTWPDADTAERAARAVVEERLAACANIVGSASRYTAGKARSNARPRPS